jgi:hypothetical protein
MPVRSAIRSARMSDDVALVRMPDPVLAPGYKASLGGLSHFSVADLGAGIVTVAPAEGAGQTAKHFELHRLCDAGSDLDDPATWRTLRENPPRATEADPAGFRARMIALGNEVQEENSGIAADMVAFNLAAMGAAQTGELPQLLKANLPALFGRFPGGSLWQVTVSGALLARRSDARSSPSS